MGSVVTVIIIFLVGDYFFIWFVIKSSPRITSGPHHKLHEIRLVQAMKGKDERSKKVRDLVKKFVAKGAWHAHSEHVLLCLLNSESEEDRRQWSQLGIMYARSGIILRRLA